MLSINIIKWKSGKIILILNNVDLRLDFARSRFWRRTCVIGCMSKDHEAGAKSWWVRTIRKSTVKKDCCYEHGQLYNKHSHGTMTPPVCPLCSISKVKQTVSRKGDLTTKLSYLTLFWSGKRKIFKLQKYRESWRATKLNERQR